MKTIYNTAHDTGFNWSLEGLSEEQMIAVNRAADAAAELFSAEVERSRARHEKAMQRAHDKMKRTLAEIYGPYRT